MDLDRADTEIKTAGDLLRRLPLSQQPQHLGLPFGQSRRLGRTPRRGRRILQRFRIVLRSGLKAARPRQRRRDIDAARQDRHYCPHDLFDQRGLQNIAMDARAQAFQDRAAVILPGNHGDLCRRMGFAERAQTICPGRARHAEIHQQQISRVGGKQVERGVKAVRLDKSVLGTIIHEDQAHCLAHQGMVIGDQDPQRRGRAHPTLVGQCRAVLSCSRNHLDIPEQANNASCFQVLLVTTRETNSLVTDQWTITAVTTSSQSAMVALIEMLEHVRRNWNRRRSCSPLMQAGVVETRSVEGEGRAAHPP
ncbi:MAG TPA: hypothetical protein VFE41_00730 [Acetobacteraceae bacterium]|nr:hypothetical protein [Acetobacteraceae bacterium]